MKLACATLTLANPQTIEIEDIFKRARLEGFHLVDLAMMEGWHHINPSDANRDFSGWLERTKAALAANDLQVCAINSNYQSHLTDPDPDKYKVYLAHFNSVMDFAQALGCSQVVIQPGKILEGMTFEACRAVLANRLVELGTIAQEKGVNLSVEPHKNCVIEDPKEALSVIREVYPLVGCCYDPSHFTMQGIELPDTRDLLDLTYHVHVRNASIGRMQEVAEKGLVDYEWVYKSLTECGYPHCISIEYFNAYDPELVETRKVVKVFEDLGCTR